MYSCEYLLADFDDQDCGVDSARALSVRHELSDVWQCWPVCSQHLEALRSELVGIGFVVSASYPVGDCRARQAAESAVGVWTWSA